MTADRRVTASAESALPVAVRTKGQIFGTPPHTDRSLGRIRGTSASDMGSAFLLIRQGGRLGFVNDPWVAKELMMAYFADKDVISSKVRSLSQPECRIC